jgi:hypothetical protein
VRVGGRVLSWVKCRQCRRYVLGDPGDTCGRYFDPHYCPGVCDAMDPDELATVEAAFILGGYDGVANLVAS